MNILKKIMRELLKVIFLQKVEDFQFPSQYHTTYEWDKLEAS